MNKSRILIVEDEMVVALDIEQRLIRLGYVVVGQAASADAALAIAARERPDLVLMDIRLKGPRDGIEAAWELRERLHQPVVFLTAHADEFTLERAKVSEPFGYILKPFDDRDLRTVIEMAIYKQNADFEIRRLNRLYAVLSQVNRAVIGARSQPEFLDQVCRIAVETAGYQLAWVGRYEGLTRTIEAVASWGVSGHAACTAVPVPPESPGASGALPGQACPCAQAFMRGRAVVSSLSTAGAPVSPGCGPVVVEGMREIAAMPISLAGRPWGVFSVYSDQAGVFGPRETALLAEVAGSVGMALDHLEREEDRRRAEEAVQAQKQLFETLIEVIPAPIFLRDPTGRYVRCNDAFASLVRRTRDEVRHLATDELFPLEVPDRYLDADDALFREGRGAVQNYVTVVTLPDGSRRDMSLHKGVCCDAAGVPTGVVGVMLDITDLKDRERALAQNEARYRLLFESVLDGASVAALGNDDQPGPFLEVNEAACQIVGYPREEYLRLSPADLEPAEGAARLAERIRRLRRQGHARFETALRHRDGHSVPVEVSAHVFEFEGQPAVMSMLRDITDRRASEQALRESEARFRTTFEESGVGMAQTSLEGVFLRVNRRLCEILGYPDEGSLAGVPCADVTEPADLAVQSRLSAELLAGQRRSFTLAERCSRRDGSTVWVKVTLALLRTATGEPAEFIGVFEDITEQRRAEEEIREQGRRLANLFANLPGMAYRCGNAEDWPLDFASEGAHEVTGYPPEAFHGDRRLLYGDLIRQDDREAVWDAVQSAISRRRQYTLSYRLHTAGGTEKWVLDKGVGVFDDAGNLLGREGIILDISERRRAEDALRASEERFRATFDQAAVGMAQVSLEGRFLRVNARLCDILGRPAEELNRLTARELSQPEDLQEEDSHLERLLNGETRSFTLEKRYVHALGHAVWANVSVSLLRHPSGAPDSLITVVEDLTRRKQLEAQFLQGQKMEVVGQLAGGVAHDFNNILAAMLMNLAGLRDPARLNGITPAEALVELQRLAERAADLTRQLLLFGRGHVLQTSCIDLNGLLTGLVRMLERLLGEHIEVQLDCAAEPMWLEADPGMMEQTVVNLAVNARDAMPRGGLLRVVTDRVELDEASLAGRTKGCPGSFVRLQVMDTGSGMAAATLERIFEPFFTTKEVGHGTGLGLATVHGIVEQHRGWIEVESEVGQGSTFAVYLPEAAAPLEDSRTAGSPDEPAPGGTETILLVEDADALRRMAAMTLRSYGYSVHETGNGEEAMRRWDQDAEHIDLVLTDMVMPGGMTGLELIQRLRQLRSGLRAVVSSGYSLDLVRQDRSALEDVVFLPKPYQADDLARAVRKALDSGG